MYERFAALPEEKRLRIINSALSEFSKRKYEAASTDEISKSAAISKGALFSYFGSKKQLYLYIYRYAYQVLTEKFWPKFDFSCPDLFERIRRSAVVKMDIFYQYPAIFDFFVNVASDMDGAEIQDDIQSEIAAQKKEVFEKLMEGVDLGIFRDDLDKAQVINIVLWTIDGFGNQIAAVIKERAPGPDDYKAWMAGLDKYIETLKKAFYKEEYPHGLRD